MRKKYKIFISVPTLDNSSSRNSAWDDCIRNKFEYDKIIDRITKSFKFDYKIINDFSYYYDEKNNEYQTLNLLSKSMKILPKADIVIFACGWNNSVQSCAEHDLCLLYKIPCLYEDRYPYIIRTTSNCSYSFEELQNLARKWGNN